MKNKKEYTEEQVAWMERIYCTSKQLYYELGEEFLPFVTLTTLYEYCRKLTWLMCTIKEHALDFVKDEPSVYQYISGQCIKIEFPPLDDNSLYEYTNYPIPLGVWAKVLDIGEGPEDTLCEKFGDYWQQFMLKMSDDGHRPIGSPLTKDERNEWYKHQTIYRFLERSEWSSQHQTIYRFLGGSRDIMDVIRGVFEVELRSLNFVQFPNVGFAIIEDDMHELKESFLRTYAAIGPYMPDVEKDKLLNWHEFVGVKLEGLGILRTYVVMNNDYDRYVAQCDFSSPKCDQVKWEVDWEEDIVSPSLNTYEDTLFSTWSYSTGEYLGCGITDKRAYWYTGEARDLIKIRNVANTLTKETLPLLTHKNQDYKDLAGRILRVARNNQPVWWPGRVQWSYIKEVDEVIRDIKYAARLYNFEHDIIHLIKLNAKGPLENTDPNKYSDNDTKVKIRSGIIRLYQYADEKGIRCPGARKIAKILDKQKITPREYSHTYIQNIVNELKDKGIIPADNANPAARCTSEHIDDLHAKGKIKEKF